MAPRRAGTLALALALLVLAHHGASVSGAAAAPVASPRPSPSPPPAGAPTTAAAAATQPKVTGVATPAKAPPPASPPTKRPPPPTIAATATQPKVTGVATATKAPPPAVPPIRRPPPPTTAAASTQPKVTPVPAAAKSPPPASPRPSPPSPIRRPAASPAASSVPSPKPVTQPVTPPKVAAENTVLLGGTYTLLLVPSVASCARARGYLSSPDCTTRAEAPVTAQPVLQSGTARRLQFWRLEPTGNATWANVLGAPLRIQNDGRAAARTPCDSLLRVLPACSGNSLATLGATATPSWVLEGGPTAGKFYIRDSRCRTPQYLGLHKTNCTRKSPMLFAKTSTQADLLWTLQLVSTGVASVASAAVNAVGNTFNVLRVFVRPAAGPGVLYRVQGVPTTSSAASLDVTGAGEAAAGGQLRFTFTNVATAGATYNFTVQPRNSLGQGPLSAVFKFKMPLPPGPPRDLQVWSTTNEDNLPVILADFLQPANNGGAAVEGYNVIGTSTGKSNLVMAGAPVRYPDGRWQVRFEVFSPLVVYNFTAFARNVMGWGGPSNVVDFLAPNDGTCQGEGEQCVAGYSCCATTPALYCQKNLANQLLGTCEKCVLPDYFGCSAVNACCETRKCEMKNAADTNGQCRTCVGLTKFGCAELADCCAGSACQFDTATAPGGSCVLCVAPTKFGCLDSSKCCEGKLCQRAEANSAFGSCQNCIAVASHGCASNANCCPGGLCQKAALNSPLGSCQKCITQHMFGCASNSQCCADLKCEKVNATVAIGTCRTCINLNQRGCAAAADCCSARPCQKDTAGAALGSCQQCVAVAKFGCSRNADCCSSKFCQKDAAANALGSCQNCIAVSKFGCFKKADCCSGACLRDQPGASMAGTCATCIPDNKYGCESNAECCTPGYLCIAGQCRCAAEKEECYDGTNCCGGSTSLYCQLNDALDLSGTCEKCVGDAKYGCDPARNSSCCSFPYRQCGEGISGYQCKRGSNTCSRADEQCAVEADCCASTPLLMCERHDIGDAEGVCTTCIRDGEYGCSKDSHCCTTDYMCNGGFCQCSQQGDKCISDASCCGGADDASFCQRVNPTDTYGTCEVCIADNRFGCSGTQDNCCSDFMCLTSGSAKACKCATANVPCISHASCCKGGASPLYCEKDAEGDAQGSCKNCLDLYKHGCEGHSYCCWGNKCQRPDATSQGTCQLCLALLSFGCDVYQDCCPTDTEPNVCQRNVGSETIGSCQTCIAFQKHGCPYANKCCGSKTCQKDTLDSAVGTCETCVAANKFGCEATADCCDSKKCEFEAESSRIGQCKQCIADTFYGCATSADCCGSSKCQRTKPTDPLGYCQPCISNDKFGCSQAEDDCCSDFMCRANQTSLACNCAPEGQPCMTGSSCCNNLVCLRAKPPPLPVPFGNFGTCSSCVVSGQHGCLTKDSCCEKDTKLCQKVQEDAKGGTCEDCIQTDTFGCYESNNCCGPSDKCQRRYSNDTTGSCRACIAQSMYGCEANEDCCFPAGAFMPLICQRDKAGDAFGTCVACVQDNKLGCEDAPYTYTCCSDYLCQDTPSFDRACLCSPLTGSCRTKRSCCNTNHVCERDGQFDELGTCTTCIDEGSSGCSTVGDCCDKSLFCQKADQELATLGKCSTCIDDENYGCASTEDCCNPFVTCNDGRCGCAKQGESCTSEYSCCQDGAVPLYCQRDNFLAPLGTCQPCVGNSKYGCNDQVTDSCCDTTGNYACSLGLGGGLYVCRKTIQSSCSIEGLPCTNEADCCAGNPDAAEPFLMCSRKTATGTGTCEQCVPTNYNGCDTLDELSCCKGLDLPPDVCTPNGKGSAVCLAS